MSEIFEGGWLATASGGMWSIENPRPEQVHLADLAAGLSRACRYAGQLSEEAEFYSVAEHSVIMTSWAHERGLVRSRSEALFYLLHDGSEAYFGDMPTPLKALIPDFRRLEDRAQSVIYGAFGISTDTALTLKPDLKLIDTRVRLDEREVMILEPALSTGREALWRQEPGLTPLGVRPLLLGPSEARRAYLRGFAWALEAIPDDMGDTPAVSDALRYMSENNVKSDLPSFTSIPEARCDTDFSPC